MTGVCKYCNQSTILPEDMVADNPELTADELATKICQCTEAKKARYKEEAKTAIETMFDDSEDKCIRLMLMQALEGICVGDIESCTIKVASNIKVAIKMTSKGKIRIDRTISNNEAMEL